jgi:hypothetical protein
MGHPVTISRKRTGNGKEQSPEELLQGLRGPSALIGPQPRVDQRYIFRTSYGDLTTEGVNCRLALLCECVGVCVSARGGILRLRQENSASWDLDRCAR